MRTITVKMTINNVEDWGVNWDNEQSAKSALKQLNNEIKRAVAMELGISRIKVEVESNLEKP